MITKSSRLLVAGDMIQVMNELANSMSLSLTNLSLWCHTYVEYMVLE